MIERFLGDGGRPNLLDAMLQQTLVHGSQPLAEAIADQIELFQLAAEEALITQDADDNDMYLIIAGSFRVLVNGRNVATRGRGDHVGEMALVEPTQRRSASVIANETSIVGKLTAAAVDSISAIHPGIYRSIAKTLSRRLLERNRLVGKHREEIRVFIISSVGGVGIAQLIQSALAYDGFIVKPWTDGVFRASSYPIESLEAAVDEADFAIAIAHSDDRTLFKGQEWPTPRDNVIFELGLFMGRLGRKRAILMEPRDDKVKLPSDLSGITTIPYNYQPGKDAEALMGPACNALRAHIEEWGPFNG
ncbi:MAG: TIR domain-containing protein [Croceibacterium sp.]